MVIPLTVFTAELTTCWTFGLLDDGPIALVEEGDLIRLDVKERILSIVGVKRMHKTPEEMGACLVHDEEVWSRKTAYLPDILLLLKFIDNNLTTIFALNSVEC